MSRVTIDPFVIDVNDQRLSELRARLLATRWPDQVDGVGWEQGVALGYLQDLVHTWATEYDWRAHERRLNDKHHFRANIRGQRIHFIHERGRGPAPMPLILTHGWPSSFVEYLDLIPQLTDPEAHGGDPADAFDVVVPSLPGYAFSDRPTSVGTVASGVADRWCELMTALGYGRFGAHGSDIGAGVTARLGQQHHDKVVGIHLSAVTLPRPSGPLSDAERDYFNSESAYDKEEGAYEALQATKPQTLGYALADSPTGLAAWIVEKFRAWSDCGGDVESRFEREWLLTNLTIYWVTQTITSSMRLYWDYRHRGAPLTDGARVPVPVPAGFALFPNELHSPGEPPRELAARFYTINRWTTFSQGGHFPAAEEPELLAREIRAFFRPLRTV